MAKAHYVQPQRVRQELTRIFDELEGYLNFCKKHGYVYDESHLYNEKTPWGEWQRVIAGKYPKDNWSPYPKEKRENFKHSHFSAR
jgi:hypothetical protein